MLKASNEDEPENISIYIHIPFCNKICFYCGCNATPKGSGKWIEPYVVALKKVTPVTLEVSGSPVTIAALTFSSASCVSKVIQYAAMIRRQYDDEGKKARRCYVYFVFCIGFVCASR